MPATRRLNIRPGVSILSVLRHLNYEPWYALAEFVDNAVQDAMVKKHELRKAEGSAYKLKVAIEYDPADAGTIVVRDNAGGILDRDYDRSFKTAERPPDVGNLAEFGMGMKSAACWFARTWAVRSKALGETEERFIQFDVDEIVDHTVEELTVQIRRGPASEHYTEIVLTDLHKQLHPRTIGKVKAHLASMYRIFIRDGLLELTYNGEVLAYVEPRILKAAFFKDMEGPKRRWRKEFDISLGGRQRVYGFAALRETASVSEAGLALFRRERLIQGGADSGYRPYQIFKKSNSYTYQRLFGEVHVQGFGVTHTKDAIQWDGHEEAFLDKLDRELNKLPLRMLDQAEGYRARPPRIDIKKAAENALEQVTSVQTGLAEDVARISEPQAEAKTVQHLKPALQPFTRVMDLSVGDTTWRVTCEASNDPAVGDWLSVADDPPKRLGDPRKVTIRIALAHPFMVKFAGPGSEALEALMRVAIGIGLAELAARDGGVRMAGAIRIRLNELLRGSLSRQG